MARFNILVLLITTLFINSLFTGVLGDLSDAQHLGRGNQGRHGKLARRSSSSLTTSSHTTSSTHSGTSTVSTTSSAASATTSVLTTSTNGSVVLSSDLQTIYDRRLPLIIETVTGSSSIAKWLSSQQPDGTWTDVDYTTGCPAIRANWPAQQHWNRINTFAVAYTGGFSSKYKQYINSTQVRSAIDLAVRWWFDRDFTNDACLDNGGVDGSACPCGTPGLWNTNWFSNVILIPRLVDQVCLFLQYATPPLSSTQTSNCTHMTARSFNTFSYNATYLTGANTLDVANIGIANGLITGSDSTVMQAYGYIHAEVVVQSAIRRDGIKPDGSFGQHSGLLYNGNYGKDYSNDVLALEIQSAGTQYQAGNNSRNAFIGEVEGFQWMIYYNTQTQVLHWDFSTEGRFISFPVIDSQATAGLNINLTQITQLGELWKVAEFGDIITALEKNVSDANAGALYGNRMFWSNDYMVHRGHGYITTLKMYSTRTSNSECTNSQNPFGFHLADGVVYTYLQGDEYEDIAAAWDWNLIPGITTDYANTPLTCATTTQNGLSAFVGGVSDGKVGAAVMQYTNPLTNALSWDKSWFFLDNDIQVVMILNIVSTSAAPVFSVLDQKKHNGKIWVDDKVVTTSGNFSAVDLWHDGVGYVLERQLNGHGTQLSLSVGNKTGNWTSLGTSTQPSETVDLFAAWIAHNPLSLSTPYYYYVFPATSNYTTFKSKADLAKSNIQVLSNTPALSLLFDRSHQKAYIIFSTAGQVVVPFEGGTWFWQTGLWVKTSSPIALILDLKNYKLTVSDPSQSLTTVTITLTWEWFSPPKGWKQNPIKLKITLPQGGQAGQSVVKSLK